MTYESSKTDRSCYRPGGRSGRRGLRRSRWLGGRRARRVGRAGELNVDLLRIAIVEQGKPAEVLDDPREERTKKFLGLVLER